MMHITTSSEPDQMIRYADGASQLDERLRVQSSRLANALHHFAGSCTEYGMVVSPVIANQLRSHAEHASARDAWVRDVGTNFQRVAALRLSWSWTWNAANVGAGSAGGTQLAVAAGQTVALGAASWIRENGYNRAWESVRRISQHATAIRGFAVTQWNALRNLGYRAAEFTVTRMNDAVRSVANSTQAITDRARDWLRRAGRLVANLWYNVTRAFHHAMRTIGAVADLARGIARSLTRTMAEGAARAAHWLIVETPRLASVTLHLASRFATDMVQRTIQTGMRVTANLFDRTVAGVRRVINIARDWIERAVAVVRGQALKATDSIRKHLVDSLAFTKSLSEDFGTKTASVIDAATRWVSNEIRSNWVLLEQHLSAASVRARAVAWFYKKYQQRKFDLLINKPLNATKLLTLFYIVQAGVILDFPLLPQPAAPVIVDPNNDTREVGTDAWLFKQLDSQKEQIKIAPLHTPSDNLARYVVMVGGTNFNPKDQLKNNNAVNAALHGVGMDSLYYRQLLKQLQRLPAGAEVNLVGHSLGGMLVRQIVHESSLAHLKFSSVTTFGAPRTDGDSEVLGVKYRHYIEDEDPVGSMGRTTWPYKFVSGSDIVTNTGNWYSINPLSTAYNYAKFKSHTSYDLSMEANNNQALFEIDKGALVENPNAANPNSKFENTMFADQSVVDAGTVSDDGLVPPIPRLF